ncbi:MAG: hypothetical protein KC912_11590 [Proteobacteria bacterium]|nr:hypothetical protein [Pseudomonadota bacterium]
MRLFSFGAAALLLTLAGCKNDESGGDDTDGSSDSNSGSDSSVDSNSTSDVECGDTPTTPAPGSGPAACLTAELQCGDTVTHTTTGGTTVLDAGYSSGSWSCIGSDPLTADYSGPERRYWVTAPAGVEPVLTLTSDCDLTMKVVRVASPCPSEGQQVDCSDATGDFDERIQTATLFPDFSYEVIVESVDGGEGAFTLDYHCP